MVALIELLKLDQQLGALGFAEAGAFTGLRWVGSNIGRIGPLLARRLN
ncbi:hypothetical protein [Amycolatopsis sp. NPDC003731]